MTSRERISRAQTSSHLQEADENEVGDIDIIRACGMVGAGMPLGASLWRLKFSGDTRELASVLDGLLTLTAMRFAGIDTLKTVQMVVKHWLDDVCKPCHGRGYEIVPGTPILSEVECGVCKGQGRVKLAEPDEAALWLIESISRMERGVAAAIMKKLNAELDF